MKKILILAFLAFPLSVFAQRYEVVEFKPQTIATNTVTSTETASFNYSGKVLFLSYYCSTNSTGTVSTVSGTGASYSADRVIWGPLAVAAGTTVTNLAVPVYLAGDKIKVSVAPVSQLSATSKAGVVVEK